MDLLKTTFFLLELGGMGCNTDIDGFRNHISKRVVLYISS